MEHALGPADESPDPPANSDIPEPDSMTPPSTAVPKKPRSKSVAKSAAARSTAKGGKGAKKVAAKKPATKKVATKKAAARKTLGTKAKAGRAAGRKVAPKARKAKPGKYAYFFGDGKAEGNASMREILGGKGANPAEMWNLGLPVPAGLDAITTLHLVLRAHGRRTPPDCRAEVEDALHEVERAMGKRFGDPERTRCSSRCAPARGCRCRA